MLSQEIKISNALDYASGTAGRNGLALDMQGWDGVLMLVRLGAVADGAVTSIKAQQGSASDLNDAADLEGTKITIAGTDDNGIKYIDLYQPQERYVRLVVDKDGANACAESASYIQYRGRVVPSTHGPGVSGEAHLAPYEGAA